MLTIYNKNATAIHTIKEYEYSSEFMGDRKITTSVSSPNKMAFAIGDYITFRSQKFAIYNKPIGTKKARSGENIGDALKYDLIFYAPERILQNINFEDYVSKDDTNQYYTGTSTLYFFNNVKELAIRLQANLDRFTGENTWNVSVSDDVILEELQISVSNLNLWNGLLLANTKYGLNFYINGTNIVIGGEGDQLSTTFYYGKDKGLYEIQRTYESDENIITRLKTYGASRNLPTAYLREEDAKGRYFTQLMLPNFATTGIDYVDASAETIAEYGIIEGVKVFDDVYPSIEEIDLGSGRIDEIVSIDTIDPDSDYFTVYLRDLGFDMNDYWTSETPLLSIKGTNSDGSATYLGGYEFEIVQVVGNKVTLQKNQADNNILPDQVSTVRAGDRFVLLGISMPYVYVTNAENKLALRATEWFTDEGGIELAYAVKVDEKYITVNNIGDTLESGKKAKIEDDDLDVANYLTIQSVSIKYGSVLPVYDMKLSNIKASTLKEEFKKTASNQNMRSNIGDVTNKNVRTNKNLVVNKINSDITWQ